MTQTTKDISDATGFSALLTTSLLWVVEFFSLSNVNDLIVTATGTVGLVWVCWRVALIRKQTKGQQLENEIKEIELKKIKEDEN